MFLEPGGKVLVLEDGAVLASGAADEAWIKGKGQVIFRREGGDFLVPLEFDRDAGDAQILKACAEE